MNLYCIKESKYAGLLGNTCTHNLTIGKQYEIVEVFITTGEVVIRDDIGVFIKAYASVFSDYKPPGKGVQTYTGSVDLGDARNLYSSLEVFMDCPEAGCNGNLKRRFDGDEGFEHLILDHEDNLTIGCTDCHELFIMPMKLKKASIVIEVNHTPTKINY